MVMRRQPTQDSDGVGDEPETTNPFEQLAGDGGGRRVDEFGNVIPDFPQDQFPVPFQDYVPNEIAGNPDAPRDIFGSSGPRQAPGGASPSASTGAPDMGAILAMLPQGVEAQGAGAESASAPPGATVGDCCLAAQAMRKSVTTQTTTQQHWTPRAMSLLPDNCRSCRESRFPCRTP